MQLKKVSKKMKGYSKIKKLYKQAFPSEERAPFWLLMKKASLPVTDFWALYEEEKWVGIAYMVKGENIAYLFYLAINEEERGSGYGSKTIELLKEYYKGSRLFLALETMDKNAPNYEQRVKRHGFYEKCGLSDMPYQIKEASVVYDIMGVGGTVEPEEYGRMMREYLGPVFSRLIDVRIIKEN